MDHTLYLQMRHHFAGNLKIIVKKMLLLIASQKQANFFQAFSLEIKWRQYKTDLN